jgi:hypothetical protein
MHAMTQAEEMHYLTDSLPFNTRKASSPNCMGRLSPPLVQHPQHTLSHFDIFTREQQQP